MKLTETAIGSIVEIIGMMSMNERVRRRLGDLCIAEGSRVSLRYALPFRGPCMIESGGQCVAIRRKEAACIEVAPI